MVQIIITKEDLIELVSKKLNIDTELIDTGKNFNLIVELDIDKVNLNKEMM